ncbi:LysR substrate-binding domain-containing protein [Archangium violaceum]|uniref:LysR substrate-binding domain-containing protein n=1 Tax=Archangium violaceum TaxID=83451 RepID=UPI0036DEABF0
MLLVEVGRDHLARGALVHDDEEVATRGLLIREEGKELLTRDQPLTFTGGEDVGNLVDYTGSKGEQGLPAMQRIGGFVPRIRYQSTDIMAVISLVAAGLGVAIVPSSIVSLNIGGNVIYRPLTGVTGLMEMSVAYRRNEKAPAVRAFLKVIQEQPR